MPTMHVNQAAEAICGALHRFEFQFLGDTNGGAVTWFTRGNSPKLVRVKVTRSDLAPVVLVDVEWPNISTGRVIPGAIVMQVDTRGSEAQVVEACESAVRRCLEIFRDVLQGEGVAGREAVAPKPDPGDEVSPAPWNE